LAKFFETSWPNQFDYEIAHNFFEFNYTHIQSIQKAKFIYIQVVRIGYAKPTNARIKILKMCNWVMQSHKFEQGERHKDT
jgi:hypothetical protein